MLVVYCLKDVQWLERMHSLYGIPGIVGIVATAAVHVWPRKLFFFMAEGIAIYMILVRVLACFFLQSY